MADVLDLRDTLQQWLASLKCCCSHSRLTSQVSLRIAASSERQASTVQDDKPSTRHLGTSRQLRRDTSDQVWKMSAAILHTLDRPARVAARIPVAVASLH